MKTMVDYGMQDQVVLVTGAGSGIGRAIARAFLAQGARVALVGRRMGALQETGAGFTPDRFLPISADMTQLADITQALDKCLSAFGRLDAVIANAGLSLPGRIDELDPQSWETMRSLNLDGVVHLARECMPSLIDSRGTFTAVSSIAGLGGDWRQTGYNATKAGVNALVQSMALDLGAHGVRVNAVAPGFTRTEQTSERLGDREFLAKLTDRLGLPRAAEPEDVARAVLFLSSAQASYITGVVLPVDGGLSAANGAPRPV